jgi:signal transduction histidine kinase/PAS domain-containing protein
VILLSARAGEESRVEGLSAGADDYLVKPFSARELIARVRSHLAMSRVRRQAAELERALREQAEAEHRRLEELFMQSPAGIAFISGPEHRFTFVNSEYVKSSGRQGPEDFVGKTVHEVFPELAGYGFWEILDNVYRTGIPYIGTAAKVPLKRVTSSKLEDVYYDFTYQPFRGPAGRVEGILVHVIDVTERKHAEEAVRQREAELVRDMNDLSRIQQIGTRLVGSNDLQMRLAEVLSAAADLAGTDKGNIQLYDPESCRLRIIAHQGFGKRFLERFMDQGSAVVCDVAAQKIQRMIWEDVAADPALQGTEDLEIILGDGIRAIQSTPLLSLDGKLLGLLNNHFGRPHRPSERDLHYLDVLARMAADFIERWQSDNALRQSEQRFRTLADSLEERVKQRTTALETAQDELRDLSAKLLMAQDEERRRIARELHDSAGQTLTVLGMNLAQVIDELQNPSHQALKHIETSQELVQQLHNEIRTTSYLLHPPLLDECGIASAIGWYIDGIKTRTGLKIRLEVSEDFGRVPKDMELVVFRIVQECLTNIHRHSDAKTALIRLSRTGEDLNLVVEDNGAGISPEKLMEIQSGGSGVGIRGMRERVRPFHGNLTIDSDTSGTRISLVMPLSATRPSDKNSDPEPLRATM